MPAALASVRTGKPDQALEMGRRAVKNRRTGAERAMGYIYEELGDLDAALRWYERAMDWNGMAARQRRNIEGA